MAFFQSWSEISAKSPTLGLSFLNERKKILSLALVRGLIEDHDKYLKFNFEENLHVTTWDFAPLKTRNFQYFPCSRGCCSVCEMSNTTNIGITCSWCWLHLIWDIYTESGVLGGVKVGFSPFSQGHVSITKCRKIFSFQYLTRLWPIGPRKAVSRPMSLTGKIWNLQAFKV